MKKPRVSRFDFLIVCCIVLLMVLISYSQNRSEHRNNIGSSLGLNYLPSGKFLKGMALGYDEAFADFLWVRTVGYFGAQVKGDRDFTWLSHMLKLTSELDPRYESPYEFGGVVLPSELALVDEGMAMLEAGIKNIPKHNPRYWLQPFYLGFCHMIYKDNPLKAAHYYEMAAGYPQSPGFLPLLISRLYARAGKSGVGIDIIQSVLNANKFKTHHKASFDDALKKRIRDLLAAEHIEILENAVLEYKLLYQKAPSQLNDLVDGLIVPYIPEDPSGGTYFLSFTGNEVISTRSEGKFRIFTDGESPQMELSEPSH